MPLEYINLHTLPCGCRFLLAWEETRVRTNGRWEDRHPDGQDRQFRIVNQAQAEDAVQQKRAHPDWAPQVRGRGQQPEHSRCSIHTNVPNSKGGYQQVVADNAIGG